MGHLSLILGPMFSDKTTTLIHKLKQHCIAKQKIILIKPSRDTRYNRNGLVSSHDGLSMNAINISSLEKDPESIPNDIDVIGIDEGHFFPNLFDFCARWLAKGVSIYIAALNGTYERKPFPVISNLIPLADEINFKHGVCVICNSTNGSCSVKISSEGQLDENGILVGGDDKFTITCSHCYTKEITKEHLEERKRVINDSKRLIKWTN